MMKIDEFDISHTNQNDMDLNMETMKELEKAYNLGTTNMSSKALPLLDEDVCAKLELLGEPKNLPQESPTERHDRLKIILNKKKANKNKAESHTTELWYHEGGNELLDSRIWISYYSLSLVQERLQKERDSSQTSEFEKAAKSQEMHKCFNTLQCKSSQFGDERPLTFCQISPDGKSVVTASRSGTCKQWDLETLETIRCFQGHNDHAGSIVFHPTLYASESNNVPQLASCCSEGWVLLWNLKREQPIHRLPRLPNRISRVVFHPSGRFLASTCFDKSWRLYDLQCGTEVLRQEGHSRECFNLAFNSDGSLAVSVGFDARALLWDLRTGRCVLPLDGHVKKTVAVDIANDGFYLATGSEDQKVIIWDIRMQKWHYTIAAHTNLVSHVKFHDGCLITSSFDKTCRVWTHPGWFPLRTFEGHEQKVSCFDISHDKKTLVTASFDRTFKIWC